MENGNIKTPFAELAEPEKVSAMYVVNIDKVKVPIKQEVWQQGSAMS